MNKFLEEKFPKLILRPPLFYKWNTGIRFELGVDYDSDSIHVNCPYLQDVYHRAISLFKSLHVSDDDILIIVDVNDIADGFAFKHKLNVFSKYVKQKSVLYTLQKQTIPYVFPEDDEDGTFQTHRFTLKCKPSDIDYLSLLKAICNQDMGLKPRISHDVYFINLKRDTIFHVYDDRGCDVISTSPDAIRNVYHQYNNWILEYDRRQIDKVFKNDA